MLRRQPSSNTMSFLAGNSEMARRIRDYDWADHPFGPPEGWPQSLRSAVSICLQSAFPTAIYWGSELRLLYNDAWTPIPGPRHPAALGAPAREVWSDIWHIIEPQFTHLIATGEGMFVEDQLLPMRRFGVVEETYWNYSFTPIRGEDGAIAGVFNSGSETTGNVLLRRKLRFLLDLGESFRTSGDSRSARRIALEMLGKHLGVDRTGFRELVPGEAEDLSVTEEWTAPGVSSLGRSVKLSDLGTWAGTQIAEGRVLRIDDLNRGPETSEARRKLAEMGVFAALAVPWIDRGQATAVMFLHSRKPRVWTDFEVATTREVLERTLRRMEREKAAERERIMSREIDHRARNALAIVQSVVRLTAADTVADFRKKIEDRIAALARTHSLLSSEHWEPIELGLLLNEELSPYAERDSTAIHASGPKVPLPSEQAQTMALLLHELATNAAKHGALSSSAGKLEVTWTLDQSGALVIRWLEDVPSIERLAPRSTQPGFGTTMLNRVIERQLGGSISRNFYRGWLHCVLTIPLGSGAFEAETSDAQRAETGVEAYDNRKRTVLIVEDEAVVALDLEHMIEDLGYEVFGVASSVESGLAALDQGTPTVAVIDVNLGGQSSHPIAEALIARGVPLVFCSGYTEIPDLTGPLARVPRLAKPISQSDLESTLAALST